MSIPRTQHNGGKSLPIYDGRGLVCSTASAGSKMYCRCSTTSSSLRDGRVLAGGLDWSCFMFTIVLESLLLCVEVENMRSTGADC